MVGRHRKIAPKLTFGGYMRIQAEWAVKSKLVKDQEGYRVLACSRGIMSDEFERFFRANNVGNMSDGEIHADASAPWITFATLQSNNGKNYYCVIQQNWLDYSDASGRRVAAICCLCIPSEDLFVTMPRLSQLVKLMDLPKITEIIFDIKDQGYNFDFQPLSCDLPENVNSINAQAIAEELDNGNFEVYARLASALLQDSITLVVQPDQWTWEERLIRLERILSLLPYSLRLNIPFSIWAQSNTPHKMRLRFSSSFLKEGQLGVDWRQDQPGVILKSDISRRYHDTLLLLQQRKRHDISKIVRHLSGFTEPINLENPQKVFHSLVSLDQAYFAYREIMQSASLSKQQRQNIRKLFEQGHPDRLESTEWLDLQKKLLPDLEEDEISIIRNYWDEELLPPTIDLVRNAVTGRATQRPFRFFENLSALLREHNQSGALFVVLIQELDKQEKPQQEIRNWTQEKIRGLNNFICMLQSTLESHFIESGESPAWLEYFPIRTEILYWWAWLLLKSHKTLNGKSKRPFLFVLANKSNDPAIDALRVVWSENQSDDIVTSDMMTNAVKKDTAFVSILVKSSILQNTSQKIIEAFSEWFLPKAYKTNTGNWLSLITSIPKSSALPLKSKAQIDCLFLVKGIIDAPLFIDEVLLYPENQFHDYLTEFVRLLELSRFSREYIKQHLGNYLKKSKHFRQKQMRKNLGTLLKRIDDQTRLISKYNSSTQ